MFRKRHDQTITNKYNPELKVTVLGSRGSGRSSVVVRFVCSQFVDKYDPTIMDSYRKSFTVDNHPVLFDIFDTVDQKDIVGSRLQTAMFERYFSLSEGFLIIFSPFSRDSFDAAKQHFNFILKNSRVSTQPGMSNVELPVVTDKGNFITPIILVCNKADLIPNSWVRQNSLHKLSEEIPRVISREEAINLSGKYHALYREVSALDNTGDTVMNSFFDLWRRVQCVKTFAKINSINSGVRNSSSAASTSSGFFNKLFASRSNVNIPLPEFTSEIMGCGSFEPYETLSKNPDAPSFEITSSKSSSDVSDNDESPVEISHSLKKKDKT